VPGIEINEDSIHRDEFLFQLVQERKVKQIGRGAFATVFALPKEHSVIKICRDSAYLAYITAVLRFQTNPWFPRVYSAAVYYPPNDPWFFVVEMERLRKGKEPELRAVVQLLDSSLQDLLLIGAALHVPRARMRNLAQMRALLLKLYRKYGPDVHKGNIMFRRNHPVVIDPIVSGDATIVNTC
jgi:hypothetical protein